MRIKRLCVEFHVLLFRVCEIRSWAALGAEGSHARPAKAGWGHGEIFFLALSSQGGPARRKERKQSREDRTQHGHWPHMPSTRHFINEFYLILPRKKKHMQRSGSPGPLPDRRAPVICRGFHIPPLPFPHPVGIGRIRPAGHILVIDVLRHAGP